MNLVDTVLSFHKKHRWLSHLLYWFIFLLISVSASKYADGKQGTYSFEFISDALYISTEVIAGYGLAYLIIPQFVYRKKYVSSIIAFIVLSYAVSVLGRIFIVKICEPMAGVAPKAFETYTEILTDIPKLIYVYYFQIITVAFVFVFFKIFKDQLETQKRALALEKEKAETELKMLKNQLNPHFLFNTLNNIYSLSLTSSTATSPSIARLADILDHILYRCNDNLVPLKAELSLLENYIGLEKLRYDERLTVNFTADIAGEIKIAPLVLLSLTENAFKHGASDDAGSPEIKIELRADQNRFWFSIVNTMARDKPAQVHLTERIGLQNLRRQLDLVYGSAYSLEINKDDCTFRVELTIPA
ncbi:sensor histidine kinase [Mucilaginibacter ximonensis]|uniref:Sensor histidine kinase n=1 Tax=Mucilaginibacter ximonensis TaxID=538021 RepID=A0ABW5YFY0_9SPHI